MIAGDTDVLILAKEFNTLPGVGAIANNVSQTPDTFESTCAVDIVKNRLEGSQIAVDVGDDSITHVITR